MSKTESIGAGPSALDVELAYRIERHRERIPAAERCPECNGTGLEQTDPLRLPNFVAVCIPCLGTPGRGRERFPREPRFGVTLTPPSFTRAREIEAGSLRIERRGHLVEVFHDNLHTCTLTLDEARYIAHHLDGMTRAR